MKNPKKQKKNGYDRSVYRSLAMITQFGINMLVPIVLCGGAGMYLDKLLGTSFLSVILFFVGALAQSRCKGAQDRQDAAGRRPFRGSLNDSAIRAGGFCAAERTV